MGSVEGLPVGRLAFVLLAGLLSACGTEPGDINSIGATIFGRVSRDGVGVPGVEVRSFRFATQCGDPTEPRTPEITDSLGRYRDVQTAVLTPPGTPFCVVVRAVFDRDGITDSVTISGIPITMSDFVAVGQPRDSFRVDIALPP